MPDLTDDIPRTEDVIKAACWMPDFSTWFKAATDHRAHTFQMELDERRYIAIPTTDPTPATEAA